MLTRCKRHDAAVTFRISPQDKAKWGDFLVLDSVQQDLEVVLFLKRALLSVFDGISGRIVLLFTNGGSFLHNSCISSSIKQFIAILIEMDKKLQKKNHP